MALTPRSDTLVAGRSAWLSARLTDATGREVRGPVTWSSSDSAVARVASDGRVTGTGAGTAVVVARSGERADSGRVFVSLAPGVHRDLPYCGADSLRKMDVYIPSGRHPPPRPAAVFIHGGAWVSGDKQAAGWRFGWVRDSLLARGYVVATLNYRLAPAAPWPAQIEDVRCAVRALRARAVLFGLDPGRMVAWGTSVGSHLASLLAAGGPAAGAGTDSFPDVSSRVQGVVDIAGPADLTHPDELHVDDPKAVYRSWPDSTSAELIGASPTHQLRADAPPFYIIHGDRDAIVDLNQAARLYQSLGALAVPRQMLVVLNGNHSIGPEGGPIVPDRGTIARSIVEFIDRCVREAGRSNQRRQ